MTFSTDQFPDMVQWAKLTDPDGEIADIAWTLAQCNSILKDPIWQESNMGMNHKVTINTGLPQGTWRGNNQGAASSVPTFADFVFGIGMLTSYSKVDQAEADLNGQTNRFRYVQDQSHIMGMSQQVATAMFYANEAINPKQFTGFSPYYSALSTTVAQTAKNVINAGGSGNANASLWQINWGDDTIYNLFPKGSTAGLVYKDKGDTRGLYDANGNEFEGFTSYFEWKIGLCVKNWEYVSRLANIDTTTAGLKGSSPPDLNYYMCEMAGMPPESTARFSGITETDAPGDPRPGTNGAWYCNRAVRIALDQQAIRDKNVLISYREFAGEAVMFWRDFPVRVSDCLLKTEATIS